MTMRMLFVLMLLMALGGCKTMQVVPHDDLSALQGQVEPGDEVEVLTTDGRTLAFTVTEVSADALVGRDVRVQQPDISRLRVKAVNKPRTFGTAFAGGAVALWMIIAASAAAILSGSGG
jgi:hypothetical protein